MLRATALSLAFLTVLFAGCVEEPAAPAAVEPQPIVMWVETATDIGYSGKTAARACVMMCVPPFGGGTENPHMIQVNDTPKSMTLKMTWTPSPGAASQYELIVSALPKSNDTQGGAGGGGRGMGGRELGRAAGGSPLQLEINDIEWNGTEDRIRLWLRVPSALPIPVTEDTGQAFKVEGTLTTVKRVTVMAPVAVAATTTAQDT